MNKLKLNRKHHIDPTQIEKFVYKNDIVWVYLKPGNYPPILKTDCSPYILRNKLVNLGLCITDFKVEEKSNAN
jgi:hypothetical protein